MGHVSQYYVPQILRLVFGASMNTNAHPALEAYKKAYPEETAKAFALAERLDLLKRGDHQALLQECTLEKMEAAGSGGTAELNAGIATMAFTRGPADVLAYMPAIAWRSGTGMVVWNEVV